MPWPVIESNSAASINFEPDHEVTEDAGCEHDPDIDRGIVERVDAETAPDKEDRSKDLKADAGQPYQCDRDYDQRSNGAHQNDGWKDQPEKFRLSAHHLRPRHDSMDRKSADKQCGRRTQGKAQCQKRQ